MADNDKLAIPSHFQWFNKANTLSAHPSTLTPLTIPDYLHCQYGLSYINRSLCKDSAMHGNFMVCHYVVQCISLA